MEHVEGIIEECTAQEDKLRPRLLAELKSESPRFLPTALLIIESFDEEKCEALYGRFVANQTWHVPTLMIHTIPDRVDRRLRWRGDPRIRFVPAEERRMWVKQEADEAAVFGRGDAILPFSRKMHEITAAMHSADVRLLAGSDAGFWGIFWGSGLHDELELLNGAGMTTPKQFVRQGSALPNISEPPNPPAPWRKEKLPTCSCWTRIHATTFAIRSASARWSLGAACLTGQPWTRC